MAKFSFRLPNADYLGFPATTKAIVQTAVKAEELGFDALFVNDHVIVDDSPRSEPWRNVYDPLMVLSYVAARTSRIMLGTSVLIMPYRNPIVTAKMFATLDQMSGGRAIAGLGSGWSETEYDALGVTFRQRGARTNEYLRLWKACWEPGPPPSMAVSSPSTTCTSTRSPSSSPIRPSGSAALASRPFVAPPVTPTSGSPHPPRCPPLWTTGPVSTTSPPNSKRNRLALA